VTTGDTTTTDPATGNVTTGDTTTTDPATGNVTTGDTTAIDPTSLEPVVPSNEGGGVAEFSSDSAISTEQLPTAPESELTAGSKSESVPEEQSTLPTLSVQLQYNKLEPGDTVTAILTPADAQVSYEWSVNGHSRTGKGNTYVLTADDVGYAVTVTVIGADAYNGLTASTHTSKKVTAATTYTEYSTENTGSADMEGLVNNFGL
ncbi:MAG: hypothetical protein PHY12_03545, partial [Eubacteriales bacterium]|nr:hypothetical protein [Eubacteriales bacterium]